MFLVSAAFLPLVKAFGNGSERTGFFWAAVVFAIIGFLSMGINYIVQKNTSLIPTELQRSLKLRARKKPKSAI